MASGAVTLREHCTLDLGASAKALVADLVADELAQLGGVVVEIGGDVPFAAAARTGPGSWASPTAFELRGDEPRVSHLATAVSPPPR